MKIRAVILPMIALMSFSHSAKPLDSLFVFEKGWGGSYGFLLVSQSQSLKKFVEFDPMKMDLTKDYDHRKIVDSKRADSVYNRIRKSGFQKIKNQDVLPSDSVEIADGHSVYIRFKMKKKTTELAFNNPDGHSRREDSIVAGIWNSVWFIQDSCLAPLSEKKIEK